MNARERGVGRGHVAEEEGAAHDGADARSDVAIGQLLGELRPADEPVEEQTTEEPRHREHRPQRERARARDERVADRPEVDGRNERETGGDRVEVAGEVQDGRRDRQHERADPRAPVAAREAAREQQQQETGDEEQRATALAETEREVALEDGEMAAGARHERADDVGERDDRDGEHRPTAAPPALLHAEEGVVGAGNRARREQSRAARAGVRSGCVPRTRNGGPCAPLWSRSQRAPRSTPGDSPWLSRCGNGRRVRVPRFRERRLVWPRSGPLPPLG